jgi:hypothetical protein
MRPASSHRSAAALICSGARHKSVMSANPYTPPPWDDLLSLANKAITASAPVAVLPNGNETANVTISLAAAARSRRLMMGLVTLVESDHDDVMGGMLRTLYETWLVGIYALLGGDEALQRLLAQRDKQQKMFAKVLGEPIDELSDGQTLGVEVLAGKVTTLLESDSHENAEFARAAYTFFYRFESYRSTHGGLGSIIGHIDEDENSRTILERRPEDDDGMRHRFLLGIALLVSSAQMPAVKSGLPHEGLDQVAKRILALNPSKQGK